VWKGHFVSRRKDGTTFEEQVVVSPISGSGRFPSAVAVKQDVTRERRVEEQLRQAQKMEAVGRLAGGVAHDFNNLLTVINGFCELSFVKLPHDSPVRPNLLEIAKAGDRAATLTRQLLAFSRKQVLQPKVLEPNDLLAEMEKLLRRVIGEDVRLATRFARPLSRVKADPAQLEQVVMNLALNARDAMPKGGTLTLATDEVLVEDREVPRGVYVRISVADTGIGMKPEVMAHLFEPFFTTKALGKGTGLGLATADGIVEQSGGFVTVESAPGKGSTFRVHLPRTDELPEMIERSESALPSGHESVLLVEDDETVRAYAATILRGRGYFVSEAGDAAAARTLFARETFDLVLTDVILPGEGGASVARELKRSRPQVKVLFMSGYTDDQIASHGVLEPGVALLEKPFTSRALLRKVREVLSTPRSNASGWPAAGAAPAP
ncbi:MAG TPA: ATP-binding protein, partial [Thermoanaerobaculia bacterium]|nr:ATP-binding protein [Thermoanaerobaculia bacterium]